MNIKDIATPSYIVDEGRLKSNLEILKSVIDRTGCRILLAQKCFSMYAVYPLIGEYISGCTASGLFEARLGITIEKLEEELRKNPGFLEGVDGFHFHTLCEQNSDDLETTLEAVEQKFGKYLYDMKWLNMGGGHHITRKDYDVERLVRLVNHMKEKYQVQVYLEPGEAVALNAGYLKTTVLDIVENAGITTLILDASAACHMPDVLEMPYRPPLKDSGEPGRKRYTYRLSSYTCLAGDIIGDYSFDRKIQIGDTLYFEDMAIYSMVKNNTFNGIGLPDIVLRHENGECEVVKHFGYEDFKGRLS